VNPATALAEWLHVTPLYLLALLVFATFGFVVSSVFGVGGVVLLIPLLSERFPPVQAVAVSAPVMLVNNVGKALVYRKHVDKTALWAVSALAVPAAFVSALFSASIDGRVLLLAVAGLVFASVIVERVRKTPTAMSKRQLMAWGGVTGVISGLCGAAGPPTAIGLRGYGLSKEVFVGTVAVFATFLQLAKIPAYIQTRVLSAELIPLALFLSVLSAASVLVGPWALRSLDKKKFGTFVDVILMVSAIWLVIDVVRDSV
jgi:uncharacterized protein